MGAFRVVLEWVDTLILATIFAMILLIASVAVMRLLESLRTARRRLLTGGARNGTELPQQMSSSSATSRYRE